jgi:hypothetical protein
LAPRGTGGAEGEAALPPVGRPPLGEGVLLGDDRPEEEEPVGAEPSQRVIVDPGVGGRVIVPEPDPIPPEDGEIPRVRLDDPGLAPDDALAPLPRPR